jgi:hypothetical protein
MGIEENLKARLAAEQIAELAVEEAKQYGRRFWEELVRIVNAHVPSPPAQRKKTRAMTDGEARLFGKQPMPFGQHVGTRIDDVPLDYLRWYADETFQEDLRRYLESNRVKRETRE